MGFSAGVQVQGLQKRKLRQAVHDERCRPVLERVARMKRKSYSRAVIELTSARVPSPRGGKWRTGQVHRIAARLGLDLGCGRCFGELPRCMGCHARTGWQSSDGMCRRCNAARSRRRGRAEKEWRRSEEIRRAKEQVQYYTDKLEALRAGRRHYSRQHPEPTQRFGKPLKFRLVKDSPKRGAG